MRRLTASVHALRPPVQVAGAPRVDLHHMDILALADDISIAAEIGMCRAETEKAVSSLLSDIGADLLAEEHLMYVTNYPALGAQRQEHERLAERLSEAYAAFGCDEATALGGLLECVRDWVCGHGVTMDRQFETYLLASAGFFG